MLLIKKINTGTLFLTPMSECLLSPCYQLYVTVVESYNSMLKRINNIRRTLNACEHADPPVNRELVKERVSEKKEDIEFLCIMVLISAYYACNRPNLVSVSVPYDFEGPCKMLANLKGTCTLNPITGRVMQICITLDIFFNTAKAQICTYSKLFDFHYIHIWHIFAKFHASK